MNDKANNSEFSSWELPRILRMQALSHTILESSLDAIVAINGDSHIIEWNHAAETMFGYSKAEAQGRLVKDLIIPPKWQERYLEGLPTGPDESGEPFIGHRREAEGLRKNGDIFPIELSISVQWVSEKPIYTAYIRDLTEIKQTERALKNSESRFQTIAAYMPGMIYQWYERNDGQRGFYYVSPRSHDILGIAPKDLLADWTKFHVHPDDTEAYEASIRQAVKSQTDWHFEGRYLLPSGTVRWFRGSSKPVRTHPDEIVFNGVIFDITDKKELDQELMAAREKELHIGAVIQKELLLGKTPTDMEGIRMAATTIPSQKVDGDFYDFYRHGPRCIDTVVGDVMGKGVPAALLGAATKTSLMKVLNRLVLAEGAAFQVPPERIIRALHKEVTPELIKVDTFTTLCYTRFDLDAGLVNVVDCGHAPPVHFRQATGRGQLILGDQMPLGFFKNATYQQINVPIADGDVLVFYSDGITEAMRGNDEFYGHERLQECVAQFAHYSPEELLDRIIASVANFSGKKQFTDDLTCMVICVDEVMRHAQGESLLLVSDRAYLDLVRKFVCHTCQQFYPALTGTDELYQVELAVNEAASNVMIHAYESQPGQPIRLEMHMIPHGIEISLIHWGKTFNGIQTSVPVFDGSQDGGYGLYIMRQFMDQVEHMIEPDGSSRIRMSRKFPLELTHQPRKS